MASIPSVKAILDSADEAPEAVVSTVQNALERSSSKISELATAGEEVIAVKVFGANPETCSPMQYGGFFLEAERDLLAQSPVPTVAIVAEAPDSYTDFLTDLPCAAMIVLDPTQDLPFLQSLTKTPLLSGHSAAQIRWEADSTFDPMAVGA